MRLLRTLFILLLCATLPLSGLAASGLTGACPMMQAGMGQDGASAMPEMGGMPGMSASAMNGMAGMAECDDMKPAPAGQHKAGGHLCKMSAQCQFGNLYHPPLRTDLSRPASLTQPLRFHYTESLVLRDPNGLWRPPRLV
ncbi:hypothetical protein [Burkholderia sp. Cy-637]|uniref:hypothetical protein n=1 Tax=Burkholderia sp. Cy-637 TaxID=2608327 RepID=UPI0014229330|nr:hypothetical protein [Burkholderia sp. Cy-637]NIF89187.1 hypothetical protein [Burkholderia sp. Cy-637]